MSLKLPVTRLRFVVCCTSQHENINDIISRLLPVLHIHYCLQRYAAGRHPHKFNNPDKMYKDNTMIITPDTSSSSGPLGRQTQPQHLNGKVVMTKEKSNIFAEKERKSTIKTMLKRRFSFSLKKTRSASKRALTPMRRRPSKTDSLTSQETNSLEILDQLELEQELSQQKNVRFEKEGRSRSKVKTHVHKFDKATAEESVHLWYTEVDMMDIIEDVKVIVRHYHRRCDRYKTVMDRVHMQCAGASPQLDSITDQMDARILEQLANADARGLEHHILGNGSEGTISGDTTRKDIVRQVIMCQDAHSHWSPEQREQAVAQKYAKLAHSAKLLAKTMGDGDSFVATTVSGVKR